TAVVERVEVVPDDLRCRPGIGGVDLRKGPGHDVAGGLSGAALDDRTFGVEVVAPLVLLERRGEDRLVPEARRVPAPDLVPEVAPVVGLEELVGQEALRPLPVLPAQHGAGPELGPGDASGRDGPEREDGDREPGVPWSPAA